MARDSHFVCQECGHSALAWTGRCPGCGEWNTLVEAKRPTGGGSRRGGSKGPRTSAPRPVSLREVSAPKADRLLTGIAELDRVLGGGLVPGSVVLLGGSPGIGESTLTGMALGNLAGRGGKVLYVSGEESTAQVRLRAERLGGDALSVPALAETSVESVVAALEAEQPAVCVIDSVQTLHSEGMTGAPGSVGQVREAAGAVTEVGKRLGITVVLVGHVTKDGSLAGPKVLEHVVDTVLSFEGERHHSHRVVRAVKNRFGAVSELGVFEMTGAGLKPVPNPSKLFLSERATGIPGSAVLCCVEGSRPLLVEVQALVSTSTYGNARRMAVGIDQSRLSLLLAVLEKRAGLSLAGDDVYVNIAGGMAIDEPAADLSVVAAVASSVRNRGLAPSTAVFGEVGLSGEVRGIPQAALRIREAAQMGFTRIVLPSANVERTDGTIREGAELVGVRTVGEALDELIP